MANNQNLTIFRGRIKFKSNVQKIWGVLLFLSIVTTLEVFLGIVRPSFLEGHLFGMKLINWIFVGLTVVKGYYIMWDFMHMRDEKKGLKYSVTTPLVIFVLYLSFILLVEGGYIHDVYSEGGMSWNF